MTVLDADRPIPPAPCLTRHDWKYETADSHCDASQFRKRQHERLMDAQPRLRDLQEQEREAAWEAAWDAARAAAWDFQRARFAEMLNAL